MSKGKKDFKIRSILLGSLIGILIVVPIICNISFGNQLYNKIAGLKVQSEPKTIAEIVSPPIPEQENAAIFYNKAFALMKSKETKLNELLKVINDVTSFSDISKWTAEERKKIVELINSKDMQYIYKFLKEGSQKPKCRFNHKYEEELLPELVFMRNAIRLLCVKALFEAQSSKIGLLEIESGKLGEAFDTLLVGLKMSNHLRDEPILISQLVKITCDNIIIECVENIAGSKGIPPGKANLIMNELYIHKEKEPFIKRIDGNKVVLDSLLEKLQENILIHEANINVCRTGLALKIYKAKNGKYPERLTDLIPEFFEKSPLDPFSGKNLVYFNYTEGFKLYSIGPNMKDDNGTPKARNPNESTYKDYDIVWESDLIVMLDSI